MQPFSLSRDDSGTGRCHAGWPWCQPWPKRRPTSLGRAQFRTGSSTLKRPPSTPFARSCRLLAGLPIPLSSIYNTTGTTGPDGGSPADKSAAIDVKKLAVALNVVGVHMNPSPQTARRHWVMDESWVYKLGETVDFMGVQDTWMASLPLEQRQGGFRRPSKVRKFNAPRNISRRRAAWCFSCAHQKAKPR